MKNFSEEFREMIKSGSYIFHIHTNYTDGISNINDYFDYASQNNIDVIIFTEHVRKDLKYNFDTFVEDIRDKNRRFPKIRSFIGCEAKLSPGGGLDIPISILSKIHVICFACHSFPQDLELYRLSFMNLFANDEWKDYVRVWVHPGRFLKKLNILNENLKTLQELVNIALSNDVLIEKNLKEDLPPLKILESVPYDRIILGYDAHSIDELKITMETRFK
jgi:histidinol phosphatase-like PHP family hydrolase